MDFKDYYNVLGVAPDADEKTIKKAYHQLAKKYHPDVNPGDKNAEEKFKEVSEAYQAISDPAKRRKYDELRSQYQQWQQRGGRGDFDWGHWQARPGDGTYTRTMSPEEFAEIFGDLGGPGGFGGLGGFSDFFSTIFGAGTADPRVREHGFGARAGRDAEAEVSVSLEEAFHGTTRIIQTAGKRIEAKIPRGVRTGSRVRLAGQGGPGSGGAPRGDLYLNVTVEPHPRYTRDGDDLQLAVSVDFYTAVLGGEVGVPTMGGEVLLKIPPLTQGGRKFRLKGKGMPKLEQPCQHGDLYAEVRIGLPEHLSEQEIQTIRRLAETRHAGS